MGGKKFIPLLFLHIYCLFSPPPLTRKLPNFGKILALNFVISSDPYSFIIFCETFYNLCALCGEDFIGIPSWRARLIDGRCFCHWLPSLP